MSGYDETETVCVNMEKTERDNLDKLFMELGKAYYEGAFEEPLPQLLPLFDKITRAKNKMTEEGAVRNIEQHNGVSFIRRCSSCGNAVEEDAVYCGICGRRVR